MSGINRHSSGEVRVCLGSIFGVGLCHFFLLERYPSATLYSIVKSPTPFIKLDQYWLATGFWAHILSHMTWTWDPFYQHGLTSVPAWICRHMTSEVWDEITNPFPNFNGCTVEFWEWRGNFKSTLYYGCNYLSMLGLKLNHAAKRGSWW